MTPAVTPQAERLLRYFEYDHLPEPLRSVSQLYSSLAWTTAELQSTDGAEQTTALRKLLEAKDAAVRSILGVNASRAPDRGREPVSKHVPPETLPEG